MKKFFQNIKNRISKLEYSFKKAFDFQDFITFISLSMIFYGFYIWKPMLGYITVGFILLFLASGIRKK